MKRYNPKKIKRKLQLIDGEWIGNYKGYILHSVFQPIWKKSLSEIYGFEGLLRVTKEGMSISPLTFLSLFTDDIEMTNVGAICASLHLRNFAQAKFKGKVFLNIHPTMFSRIASDKLSFDKVLDRIARVGMSNNQVVLEITEFKESDTVQFVSGIAAFREVGIPVAIDDYGQLESNSSRVDLLTPDIIKIDRALIQEYCQNKTPLLKELTEMLTRKGFKIVLEGIEYPEEHELLQDIPHNYVQGYLYGRPKGIKEHLPYKDKIA